MGGDEFGGDEFGGDELGGDELGGVESGALAFTAARFEYEGRGDEGFEGGPPAMGRCFPFGRRVLATVEPLHDASKRAQRANRSLSQ